MTISSGEKNDVSGVSTDQPERRRLDSVDRHLQEMLRNRDFLGEEASLTSSLPIILQRNRGRYGRPCERSSGGVGFRHRSFQELHPEFDVFHHLKYPGSALAEFRRVVVPGGRVTLFEPAMGLLGKLVYGLLHHEPLALDSRIERFPPTGERPSEHGYYAEQGNAWRLFINGENAKLLDGWNLLRCKPLCALSYVLSGGFSEPSLYPLSFLPAMRIVDRFLQVSPAIFATRLLVVLEKMG
jgi:hypothetical protein